MIGQLDRTYAILSSQSFLNMKGLANEVPIYLKTYRPDEEAQLEAFVHSLTTRLSAAGINVVVSDLFELVLELMEERGWLDRTLEREQSMPKQKLLEMLANVADPKSRLIPKLIEKSAGDDVDISFIKGVGHVFPFLRTHTILENLQPAMVRHPVVMFFPGEYVQDDSGSSELRLFGQGYERVTSDYLVKGYYRAFNLDHTGEKV